MSNFEYLKNLSVEELASWLDANCDYENAPWNKKWNEKYCGNCEPVITFVPYLEREAECSYCEIHNNCRFFEKEDEIPSGAEVCKLWLEEEHD